MNYSLRLSKLRAAQKRLNCDAIVISNLTNVRYLAGFSGSAGMLVVARDAAYFLSDFRYQSQAAQQVPSDYKIVIAGRGLWREAAKILAKHKIEKIGFESEHTSVAAWEEVCNLVAPAQTVATKRAVEDLRLEKDSDEIALMQRAVDCIDDCFDYICGVLKPGLTELEISDELLNAMRQRGASGPSFTPIVASGARGALPHGIASHKVLCAGDMITIDMGAIVDGYCSDCTRTVCLGKPTREQQKIYEIVWQAQVAAARSIAPGLGCKAADQIARKIIDEAGYAKYFGHGLGHGVGIEIHESPRLSKLGKGKLAPGMMVTCEPGIYLPDWGGVRIEDMIVVTNDGSRILTCAAKPRKMIAL